MNLSPHIPCMGISVVGLFRCMTEVEITWSDFMKKQVSSILVTKGFLLSVQAGYDFKRKTQGEQKTA